MKYNHYYNTDYGSVRVERLSSKRIDGWEMARYRLTWSEGDGRHSMEVVLDGLAGEMLRGLLEGKV